MQFVGLPLTGSASTRATGCAAFFGEWLNVSQYHPIATMPTPGELVECQIERTDRGACS